MESPNTSHQDSTYRKKTRGFTLIEVLIVLGITAIIFTFGFIISFDSYKGYLFRTERDVVVSILSKARSKSLANIDQVKHGACYNGSNYIIFDGTSYPGSNQTAIQTTPSVSLTSVPDTFFCNKGGMVFEQLTGKPTTSFSPEIIITITQDNRSQNIKINNEGTINW